MLVHISPNVTQCFHNCVKLVGNTLLQEKHPKQALKIMYSRLFSRRAEGRKHTAFHVEGHGQHAACVTASIEEKTTAPYSKNNRRKKISGISSVTCALTQSLEPGAEECGDSWASCRPRAPGRAEPRAGHRGTAPCSRGAPQGSTAQPSRAEPPRPCRLDPRSPPPRERAPSGPTRRPPGPAPPGVSPRRPGGAASRPGPSRAVPACRRPGRLPPARRCASPAATRRG